MSENLPTDFPPLDYAGEDEPTQPAPLEEIPKKISTFEHELTIIRAHHEHIARGIELFWGHRDCIEFLQKLILNGGDGASRTRSGFKHEVVEALLNMIALQEAQFKRASP
ncbi:MAG: hypothetical protein Q8K22_07110 [Rhodoferax sp.]|nr:hypothetical protein [Rhodoferax sp.]